MDKNRIAQAHQMLGVGVMFRKFTGREEISRMFDWKVELLADSNCGSLDANAILGSDMTIELLTQNGRRWFNGVVTRFAFVGKEVAKGRDLWRYEARLRPWIWYMTRQSDFKIFQNMTVPEILDEVFGKYFGFPVEKRLSGHYRKWEYCVQYQETDFNFVSRLMEHEGIYYFFTHMMSTHTLVLVDDMSHHDPCPGYDTIPYYPVDRVAVAPEECVDDWRVEKEINTGEFQTDDYDYKKSSAKLWLNRMKPHHEHLHGDHPVYEWPGGYWDMEDGGNYANLRLEELQASHERVYGQGNARGLAPGYLFTLKTHPRKDQNREYLILGVEYYIRDNPYHTGGEGAAEWRLSVSAQPTDNPYRPPRITPKPLTNGPQTAIVVGEENEEITTDEYGRVKVLFHWDQYGKKKDRPDENSSCWIRVSHGLAGDKWGAIYIPRIGQEVIVDFINGDPDYPIIIGRVYNDAHRPPYDLPLYKTYSGVKTHSTMKGTPKDWNELRFVEYKGKEQVFIHANWRMDVRVKWNMYKTVKETYHCQIGKGYYRTVGGDCNVYTYGTRKERVDGDIQCSAGGAIQIIAEGAYQVSAHSSIELYAGTDITIEGTTSVTLKCGGNFVKVDPSGVTIQGTMVMINSGGAAMPVTPFHFDDPGYASEADDGTPGYTDKPPKGGGTWKPKTRWGGTPNWGPPSPPKVTPPAPPPVPPPVPPVPPPVPPVPPPVPPVPPPAPPAYPLDSPEVKKEMAKAWDDSNADDKDKRHEEGGYIVKNPDGTYGVERWPTQNKQASIQPPPRSADGTYNGKEVVGEFHTHPNPDVDESGKKWQESPSPGDLTGIKAENYAGDSYVVGHNNVYSVGNDGTDKGAIGKRTDVLK